MNPLVSVAVPVPSLNLLTYRVPKELDVPAIGARVLVPLGQRVVTGCVTGVEPNDQGEARGTLKDVIDVLDREPFLPREVLGLALWVAEYYMSSPGEAIAAAVPPGTWVRSERRVQITALGRAALENERAGSLRARLLRALQTGRAVRAEVLARRVAGTASGQQPASGRSGIRPLVTQLAREGLVTITQPLRASASTVRTVRVVRLTAAGRAATLSAQFGARQREAIDMLRRAPDGLDVAAVVERGVHADTLNRLATRGLASIERRVVERDPFGADGVSSDSAAGEAVGDGDSQLVLTIEQDDALRHLQQLAAARRFHVALLHGVTGSGKTELYLRLARAVRDSGRSVLVLVPEIALTLAAATIFGGSFGRRIAIQHSGLSAAARRDQWHRIRRGEIDVVVGTRSAVFAPLPSLGLVVVDEEHDSSYKQEESPRYHGRDVAIMRAKQSGALVVLGSATPSLETYQNALAGRYERVTLARRVLDRPLAEVQIVDMREEYAASGPDIVLSERLRLALASRLHSGEQSLLLLNRRGFATAVFCRQCAGTLECPNCSVSLTVHRAVGRARCHYCNYGIAVPRVCARCGGPYLEQLGFGTERVEAEIQRHFPGARVARLDRDTVRRQGVGAALLARVARGEIDVLVGTQMVAKGHDFPGITLVGVISADVGLGLPDFRAAERTFQLLTQVAGRAGRGEKTGTAIVQTLYPRHYSIRDACRQDYAMFFEDEIRFRRAMRYPPVVGLINVVVRGASFESAMASAATLVARLRARGPGFRVLGPAPAPFVRLRGEHRAQLFLKGMRRGVMREALRSVLAERPELGRRVMIDVDPLTMV